MEIFSVYQTSKVAYICNSHLIFNYNANFHSFSLDFLQNYMCLKYIIGLLQLVAVESNDFSLDRSLFPGDQVQRLWFSEFIM